MFRTKGFLLIFFMLSIQIVSGQIKAIDKLEVLFEQGHYRMVLRKANRLLDQPDYDFSMQPEFYKSLALFMLSRERVFARFHPGALQEARKLFLTVKSTPEGMNVFYAHINHVVELRKILVSWVEVLKTNKEQNKYDELQQILFGLFDYIPDLDVPNNYNRPILSTDEGSEIIETSDIKRKREELIKLAKQHLGTPYQWSGNKPGGFDCSGFTSYIYANQLNKELPRRAEDQYNASRKLKQRNVQKGDLVFFNNGSGISHVGMIISEKGSPLIMIHSSSSKGIIITEIETSEYWLKRLYGFGTFVQ